MGYGIEDSVKFWCEFVGGGFGLCGILLDFSFFLFLNWEGERTVCGFCVWKFCGLGLEGRDRGRWVIGGLVGKVGQVGWLY